MPIEMSRHALDHTVRQAPLLLVLLLEILFNKRHEDLLRTLQPLTCTSGAPLVSFGPLQKKKKASSLTLVVPEVPNSQRQSFPLPSSSKIHVLSFDILNF